MTQNPFSCAETRKELPFVLHDLFFHKSKTLSADTLDRISFQLFLLYKVGIPGEDSLSLLAEDMSQAQASPALAAMAAKVGEGKSLSEAAAETGAFPGHYIHMLEIGEASGKLDEVLHALSTYYKREAAIQSALHRAITYPFMMAGLVVFIFIIMLSKVLPIFSKVLAQMGVSLPPLAQRLLQFGYSSGYLAALLAFLLLAAASWLFLRARQGRGLPIGKAASLALGRGQFASAMSMLLASGFSIEQAFDYCEKLVSNSYILPKLILCRKHMEEGLSFSKSLEQSGVFSPLQAGLLAAGTRAGDIDLAMEEIAFRCVEESQRTLFRFVGKVEFLLLLALCISVAFVLLSVMLPLVGILSAIG